MAVGGQSLDRRDIFFRQKDSTLIAAAVMERGYQLVINPTQIEDPVAAYKALSAIVAIDEERFVKSAQKEGDPHEVIATKLRQEDALLVRALALPGVMLEQEKWRVYPGKERGAHVLGFVGFKGHERVGRYGLERYWEDTLAKGGERLYINFFAEVFSNLGALGSGPAQAEGDVITSIEPTVEQRLEEVLGDVHNTYDARITGGIIMDPRNGAILALAALPTFDPNTFNTMSDSAVFSNPLVEGVFEFGSIMKPLTMAAGIDSGVVGPSTTYYDSGVITRDDAKIYNHDGRGRGRVDMQEVLSQSLNTGAAFVAEKMGATLFARYMTNLGLGEETGIDLPGEVPGIVGALSSGSTLDLASASFGQGIAVTPIAMTRALSALANQGAIVTPHVADTIRYPSGVRDRAWQDDERRVFQKEHVETVTTMLVKVVDEALLDGKLKMERYSIAAKTGTAQMAKRGGGYDEDRYLHSFFGYFPAHEPQFLVFLFTVEPKGISYASQTLAEPFGELAQFLISYYDIPPDR